MRMLAGRLPPVTDSPGSVGDLFHPHGVDWPCDFNGEGRKMFTLEIGGNPIAITDAEEAQARAIFESDEFKQDLTAMTSEGKPLWDGQAHLNVRPASQEEVAAFEAPDLDADDDFDEDEEEDGLFVTFLVPIDHDHDDVSAIPPQLQS
ncbi:hypothetical protein [Microvirga lenta]|uniref:hypothetical protein n=1 Tax=Microvirga lenta TaxID=2881337 RepID=UPI001D00009A|nr:hypothetical protein [Microvirga lenta]MCB5177596.1 hypothetical protein [Microvirga lenta]